MAVPSPVTSDADDFGVNDFTVEIGLSRIVGDNAARPDLDHTVVWEYGRRAQPREPRRRWWRR